MFFHYFSQIYKFRPVQPTIISLEDMKEYKENYSTEHVYISSC